MGEQVCKRIAQFNLVTQRQLDIDTLYAVGVLGHARQWDDHVFVDLEGIGVTTDGGGAFTVQPKLFTRLGADRHKALTRSGIGQADDLRGSTCHRISIVASDIAKQHHIGQAATLGLGGVAHSLQIATV